MSTSKITTWNKSQDAKNNLYLTTWYCHILPFLPTQANEYSESWIPFFAFVFI